MNRVPARWAFFSYAYNLGDCSRAIEVAKAMRASGAEVAFYHRGGTFVDHIAEAGFEPLRLLPEIRESQHRVLMDMDQHRAPVGTPLPFTEDELDRMVQAELEALREFRPDGVYAGLTFSTSIAARVARLPLVTLVPTALCPAFFRRGMATFPDHYDRNPVIRRFVPRSLKNALLNRIMLGDSARRSAVAYNRVRERHGLEPVYNFPSLVRGDITLLPDLPELSGLNAEDLPEGYYYTGPLFAELAREIPSEVLRVFSRPGVNVYVSFGSSGTADVLRRVVSWLRTLADHNVVVSTTDILDPAELGPASERFFAARFLPALPVCELSTLAVTHGGQGTVQTVAAAGRPLIGIAFQWEQQANLDGLARAGTAVRIPLHSVTRERLVAALTSIETEACRARAELLGRRVREASGAMEAVRRMTELVEASRVRRAPEAQGTVGQPVTLA